MTKATTFRFQESETTIWFCVFLPFSKEWKIWCEKNGETIESTREFKKRLNKELKEIFSIK